MTYQRAEMIKIEKEDRSFSMHLDMDYSDGPYSPQSPPHGIYSSPSPTHGLSFTMVKVRKSTFFNFWFEIHVTN